MHSVDNRVTTNFISNNSLLTLVNYPLSIEKALLGSL